FMDKYTAHALAEAKKAGATATEMAVKVKEMNDYKEMYKSPVLIILFTYMEILPVGLIVSVICALIFKRTKPEPRLMAE
ncbi:MAG: DUF4199 domain-containing protein, partial [Sphingobacteriales bacterium]